MGRCVVFRRGIRIRELSRSAEAAQEEADTEETAEEQDDTARRPFSIVGVGASAGGVEALSRFVKAIRRDSGMAYVLILHLSPSKGSQLANILRRETEVPVINVEDGLAIEADHIYVCVPDCDIRMGDGAFRLDKQIHHQGPPHPVDVFLDSLAEHQAKRRKAEEGEKLLLMELEHRVKNILQDVHALLRDARKRSKTVPELYEALATRIDALARTQEMLANCGQRLIDIRSLISEEAMAHAAEVDQNLFLEGPPLQLMPRAVQVLTMAVHELATNAFKFGVLSKANGKVSVSWRMETSGEALIIEFRWKETGLSITGERPPTGFGTEFIVRGLPFMLGGSANLEFEPESVLCAVTFPAEGNVYRGPDLTPAARPKQAAFGGREVPHTVSRSPFLKRMPPSRF